MFRIDADQRSLEFDENDDLLELAEQQAQAARAADIALAKTLLRIKERRIYVSRRCSSVEMFGRTLGYEEHEVRRLLRLAEAMASESTIEERVRAKAMSLPKAVALAPVLKTPELFEERSEWLKRARKESYSALRGQTRHRMAELRCGEAVQLIELRVPDSVVDRFERAQLLASRKAQRQLTRDETFEALVDFYVEANDPLLVKEGRRRVGPTEHDPYSRYVPSSVQRAIRRRAGDCCEFPDCDERAMLQFAHRRPHRFGHGVECGREERHLLLLCWTHHLMQEGRYVVPFGPTANPVWIDTEGIVVSRATPGGRGLETEKEARVAAAIARFHRAQRARQAAEREGDDREGDEDGSE